jgi:hypothetical protein
MQILGTYQFPNQTDITFTDPTIEIIPIVNQVNPEAMTINVSVFIPMEGSANGKFYVDINPVPVVNLDYNGGELVTRILERLEDFKI